MPPATPRRVVQGIHPWRRVRFPANRDTAKYRVADRVVRKIALSISNGHSRIEDMPPLVAHPRRVDRLEPFLERLANLPFVTRAESVEAKPVVGGSYFDATVQVDTLAGSFQYLTLVKRSYLDVATVRSLVATAKRLVAHGRNLLVFARYVPPPSARMLIEAEAHFIDLCGNVHFHRPPHFHCTSLGNRQSAGLGQPRVQTAATLQLLFTLIAYPESAAWPVRDLADRAGVSKSKAAATRRSLLEDRTIRAVNGQFKFNDPLDFVDQLVSGYRQILRPRLMIGRFRAREKRDDDFLVRLQRDASANGFEFALTGGHASYKVRQFYKGPTVTIFVRPVVQDLPRRLELLPDRVGPIILLKAFGEPAFWKEVDCTAIAHPWLIYAELLAESLPRGHEAAEELRSEVLQL